MLGNIRVEKSALSDTNVGQYSCSKKCFERREKWPFFVLLSQIFRTQMPGNTCVLDRGFQDENVGQ